MRERLLKGMAAVVVAACAAGAAPAAAQDARVQVTVTIPDDVIREVERLVDVATGPDLERQVHQIVREATRSVRSIGRTARGFDVDVDQERNLPARQTDRQTKTLTLGRNGSLELDNVMGDITVTASTGRAATVEIVRESRGRTDADAKIGLERVTVDVSSRADRATVQARYPNDERRPAYSVSVSYNVKAPAGTRIIANSISGDVIVQNIGGDVAVEVTSGDITVSGAKQVSTARTISGDISLTNCESDGTMDVGTISGDLTLRHVKARRISASITSGDVTAEDVTAGSVGLKSLSGSVSYSGPLAANGRYELQSHSGDVRLTVTGPEGFDLQANTFGGSIRPAASLGLRTTSSSRRSLRGTVGNGAAVVQITTFSGDIVITRQ